MKTIGLIGGNIFKEFFPVIATTDLSYEAAEATSFMDTIVGIFPSNFVDPMVNANMLQIIVMAILLGFGKRRGAHILDLGLIQHQGELALDRDPLAALNEAVPSVDGDIHAVAVAVVIAEQADLHGFVEVSLYILYVFVLHTRFLLLSVG